MAPKIPSFFRPHFTLKDFEKKLKSKTYNPRAKELLDQLYTKSPEGYDLKPGLVEQFAKDKKWAKEVLGLAKSIKASSGWIDPTKLILVAVLLLGAAGLNALFLEDWTRIGVIAGLESVFEAKVELEGFRFAPLESKAGFRKLVVANKDSPMENLFELEEGAADLDWDALLQGKAVIRRLVAQNIQIGTPRATSGALPKTKANDNSSKVQDDGANELMEQLLPDLSGPLALLSLDPVEIVKKELSNLSTPKLAQEAVQTYQERTLYWQGQWSSATKEYEEINLQVRRLAQTNVKEIKTVPQVTLLLSDLEQLGTSVQRISRQANDLVKEFDSDVKTLQTFPPRVSQAVLSDVQYLKGLVSLAPGKALDVAQQFLSTPTMGVYNEILGYATQAVGLLSQLKTGDSKKEVGVSLQRQGQRIPVRTEKAYPEFWIQELIVSVGPSKAETLKVNVSNLTNRPEWLEDPTRLTVEVLSDPQRPLVLKGQLDLRPLATKIVELELQTREPQFVFEVPGNFLDMKTISGVADISIDLGLDPQMRPSFALTGDLKETQMGVAQSSELSLLMSKILPRGTAISAKASFEVLQDGVAFKASSNIDRLVERGLTSYLSQKLGEIQSQIQVEFRKITGTDLGSLEDAQKALNQIVRQKDGALKLVAEQQKALEDKKIELEAQLVQLQQQLAAPVNDAVRQIQGNLPKLPGF